MLPEMTGNSQKLFMLHRLTADQDRLHVHEDVNDRLLVQLSELLDLRFQILIRRQFQRLA